jgi:hypothetical protein
MLCLAVSIAPAGVCFVWAAAFAICCILCLLFSSLPATGTVLVGFNRPRWL